MQRYNPKDIEPKWQQAWAETKIYEADDNSDKPKKFILEYFPYPSGAAMHVGHVRNYAIGDAMSRFARMRGYNVLHPMGWDAFGLPAENYAIKTGISPRQAIDQNTGRFKQQLTQMGFGYDWSREIDSTDPAYYKWTQWFFLMLFKKGLAYQKESLQWWCPVDKTVLANEQVEAGRCWRCGSEVEKKALKQWFFKITDYADRLEKDLDDVNWSESIKAMQRNWIGRSQGARVTFAVEGGGHAIDVFTTRPDTLFGATFLVLAPEHELVKEITASDHRQQVENYQQKARSKSDIERQETNREKTGVFTGAYATNPANGKKLPIWIADYVLTGYGTGAIMAVPAHDERDNAFARKFGLEILPVVAPSFNGYTSEVKDRPVAIVLLHDPKTDTYCVLRWHPGAERKRVGIDLPGGGIDDGETIEQAAIREVAEEAGYTDITIKKVLPAAVGVYYYSTNDKRDKRAVKNVVLAQLNSQAHNNFEQAEAYEKDAYDVLWMSKEELLAQDAEPSIRTILELAFNDTIHVGEGALINSGEYTNMLTSDAREKIVADLSQKGVAEERVNYRMRDWLISRQRYWGAPIPIIHCEACGQVAVPDDQLPVRLPEMSSFEPSDDGRSPLARDESFANTTCPQCGGAATRETDTMDGFACSSWYFLRYADPHNADKPFDESLAKYWLPVDDYIGGAEHAVMHLLYARFWTKVMQDEGLVTFSEPFTTLRNQGMILAPDGQKMSKSKGNTIQPDDLIEQGYGADSIRIMELFIGPWNQMANWSVEGMGGSFRFLQRSWNLAQAYIDAGATENTADTKELKRVMHKAIKKVSSDLDDLGFNTAIAALMETINDLYKLKVTIPFGQAADDWRWAIQTFMQLLAPFAPHITEEVWSQLGNQGSIHTSDWPVHDEAYLVSDAVVIVVQVNGKVRAQLSVPADVAKDDILAMAKAESNVATHLGGKDIRKEIFVPGKLVNFVV